MFYYLSSVALVLILLGARPALPMVVAPEAIAKKNCSGIGSKILAPFYSFVRHILHEISCFDFKTWSTLLVTHDIIGGVIFCDDLTER
jgi:hypothetical protein